MAKNITYYDSFNYDFDEYKSIYQEVNELTDEEMAEVSESDIFNYIHYDLDGQWNDFFTNLKYSKFSDEYCVITGVLGLWYGHRKIVSVGCEDLEYAIKKCLRNMDYGIIKQVGGHLEVTGIHHDGENTFEIHLLNNKGIDALYRIKNGYGNANLACRCYHKAIKDYLM